MAARPEGGRDLPRRLQEDAAAQHGRSRSREQAPAADAGGRPRSRCGAACPPIAHAICHKFDIAGHEGYIHVGFYEDGTPGEIFIKMAKEGSTISGLMDTIGVLTSMALQYGVPLEVLVSKFSHVRFEPSGFTKNPEIPMAKSLIDYIFRFLGTRFLSGEQRVAVGLARARGAERHAAADGGRLAAPTASLAMPAAAPPVPASHPIGFATGRASTQAPITFSPQADAPSCPDCGSIMVRNGACYKCLNCGATSGCS